jgi:hypothetical protein
MDNFILFFNYKVSRRHKLSQFPRNAGSISDLLHCSTITYQYVFSCLVLGRQRERRGLKECLSQSTVGGHFLSAQARRTHAHCYPNMPQDERGLIRMASCPCLVQQRFLFRAPPPSSLQRTDKIHHIN